MLTLDIKVMEADWLCSYIPPLQGSSPYNLHEGVFLRGPLARRIDPCTQMPKQWYKLQEHKLQQHTVKTQVILPKTARTHHHSVVKDAQHSCRGSSVRPSTAWVSEANAHRAWLTLWWTSGLQHSIQPQLGDIPHPVMQWACPRQCNL